MQEDDEPVEQRQTLPAPAPAGKVDAFLPPPATSDPPGSLITITA